MKILLIAVAVLAILGVAAAGLLLYVGHRVKQAVVETANGYGVELPESHPARVSSRRPKSYRACPLLSKQDAAGLLGEPIERMEDQSSTCLYYGPAGLAAKLAADQAADTFKRAQTPGSTVGGSEVANSVDQLVTSLGAGSGQADGASGGEQPLLILVIEADGKAQMTALSASKAIFGGIFKASEAKGVSFTADVPGLGDRAMRMPKLGLNVLQGETLIRIIPGPVPNADAKTVDIARTVLKRI